MLKYRQIECDFNDPVVRLCRGIILDSANDWNVVCYTYAKFLSYGQPSADDIDWSTAKVYEKVDGSLCQLYYYNGQWNVATSGTPDAGGNAGDFGFTFAELFWRVWNELDYQLPKDTNCCYACELCTPFNQVVIPHQANRLVLHGVRDLTTFEERDPYYYSDRYHTVRSFPLGSMDAVLQAAKDMIGTEQEGFVICDGRYNRVKLKCDHYVRLAHMRDSCCAGKRQMLEIIRKGESDEFLTYFPAFRPTFNDIKAKYEALVNEIEAYYDSIKGIDNRKAYAAEATKKHYSGALFSRKFGGKNGPVSVKSWIAEMHIRTLEDWLGIRGEEDET
jgi:hypothetical protein